jgi:hypothetical protein
LQDQPDIVLRVTAALPPHSDLDLAVAGPEILSVDQRLSLASDLSRTLGRDVDLVDLNTAHGALLQEVLTRGIAILSPNLPLYEKLIKRMLAEKEDDSRVAINATNERIRRWPRQTKL